MGPGIVIALIALPILIAVVYVVYRRTMTNLEPGDPKPVSGVRLTAEALHRLDGGPWRVIYQIGGALGGVDHVLIGPPGVIALTTIVADRPDPARLLAAAGSAQLAAEAAIERGPVDELARPSGLSCNLSARLFWGAPDPSRPPFEEVANGNHQVEGQRVTEWLATLVEPTTGQTITPAHIDLAWQAIVMGIGRPDPLH